MEQYKTHPLYDGYEISNKGTVRNKKTNRILKSRYNQKGYVQINLRKDKVVATKLIHRLVLQAWKGEIPNKMNVDHIDRDRKNNKLENLRVVTPTQNNENRLLVKDCIHIIYNSDSNQFRVNNEYVDTLDEAMKLFKQSL